MTVSFLEQFGEWSLKAIHDRCTEEGDCWLWAQSVNSAGYPQASINGRCGQMVRRYALSISGRLPRGRQSRVTDTCGEKTCCNPAHLVWWNYSDIQSKSYRTGRRSGAAEYLFRLANAKKAKMCKLDWADVRQIRDQLLDGVAVLQIARERGLYPTTVRNIKHGRSWKETGSWIAGL